jgi:hypothetical protein
MALHPVGPLPASTYWRRRAVLLVGVVVLLLLARSCVSGGSDRPARTSAVPTPSTTASATPTTSPRARAVVAGGTCEDAALRVSTKTDAADYPLGTSPRFTVTVTNRSAGPCRRDLGPGAVELLVYSGNDRIWSSDDCAAAQGSEVLTLKAGASLEKTVTWSGKRSAKGCPSASTRPEAKAGYYRVLARVGTVRSAATVFRLHGPA